MIDLNINSNHFEFYLQLLSVVWLDFALVLVFSVALSSFTSSPSDYYLTKFGKTKVLSSQVERCFIVIMAVSFFVMSNFENIVVLVIVLIF